MPMKDWSTTPGNNDTAGSINFAEGQLPSTVNNSARQLMADVRAWYDDLEWRDWGHTPTYISATSFSVVGDQTAIYTVGRRLRFADASTLYGTILTSVFGTVTTVTVVMDSGSLSVSLTAVSLGLSPVNQSIPRTIGTPTGGDKGAGTLNVSGGLYVNNVLITSENTNITILSTPELLITRSTDSAGFVTVDSATLNGVANVTKAIFKIVMNTSAGVVAGDFVIANLYMRPTGSGFVIADLILQSTLTSQCYVGGFSSVRKIVNYCMLSLGTNKDFDYSFTIGISGAGSHSVLIYLIGYVAP